MDLIVEVFSGKLWEAEIVRFLLDEAHISNLMSNHLLSHFIYDSVNRRGQKLLLLREMRSRPKQLWLII